MAIGEVRAGPSLVRIAPDLTEIESDARIRRGLLGGLGTLLMIADRAYFVFLGRPVKDIVLANVYFQVTVAAGAAGAGEVGIFSTPAAPSVADQTLTKIEATADIVTLATTGRKTNNTAFSTTVPAGTYLWAGVRVDSTVAPEPTVVGLSSDMSLGLLLQTSTAGALTASSTFAGVRPTVGTPPTHPELIGRIL